MDLNQLKLEAERAAQAAVAAKKAFFEAAQSAAVEACPFKPGDKVLCKPYQASPDEWLARVLSVETPAELFRERRWQWGLRVQRLTKSGEVNRSRNPEFVYEGCAREAR